MNKFTGVWTALVTPFDKNKKINYKKFQTLVLRQINAGITGIVCASTTGESPTLTLGEKEKMLKIALKLCKGKIKVLMAVGGSSTASTIDEIRRFNEFKIDGFLLGLPSYNKPNNSGLTQHISACVAKSAHPIILYYVPSRTGHYIKFDDLAKLCQSDKIVGLKDASGSLVFLNKCVKIKPNFNVLCGCDQIFDGALRLGAVGAISVASNVCPEKMMRVYNKFVDGKLKESSLEYSTIADLCEALFVETNPAPVKFAMACLGYDVGLPRLPLGGISLENKAKVREAMVACGLTKG